jgi:hypothetical protein
VTGARPDVQLWVYPEEVRLAGAERVAALAAELGADALSVALTYHQCMRVFPRYGAIRPGAPGGVRFDPTPGHYGALAPLARDGRAWGETVAALRDACDEAGLGFRAWLVALDNERLALEHERYAAQTLDGTPTVHALCPSHAAVRRYAAGLVADVVGQFAPEVVDLEAALYPRWNGYLGEIALEPLAPGLQLFGAQCLCGACRELLAAAGVDPREAHAALTEASQTAPADGVVSEPAHEVVAAVAAARDRAIARLVDDVAEALPAPTRVRMLAFGTPGSLALQGLGPAATRDVELLVGLGASAGAELCSRLDAHLSAPYRAPAAAGLNWTPERPGPVLARDAAEVVARGVRALSFYNLSLLPTAGLAAVRSAIAGLAAA